MGKQVQTDDPRFVRDIESRALLNTDHNALQQHRREKEYFEIAEARVEKAKNPANLVEHNFF